jgi:hypothetical protein
LKVLSDVSNIQSFEKCIGCMLMSIRYLPKATMAKILAWKPFQVPH